jgi:hypothetical protein
MLELVCLGTPLRKSTTHSAEPSSFGKKSKVQKRLLSIDLKMAEDSATPANSPGEHDFLK